MKSCRRLVWMTAKQKSKMVGTAARQSECMPTCSGGAKKKSPPNGRSPGQRKDLSWMLDRGHSSALDINAW